MRTRAQEAEKPILMMGQSLRVKQKTTAPSTRRPALWAGILIAAGICGLFASRATAQDPSPVHTRVELAIAAQQQGSATQTVFTAHVTDASGGELSNSSVSGGSVSFETGPASHRSSLGSALVDDEGNASLAVTSLPTASAGLQVRAFFHPAAGSPGPAATSTASASSPALVEPAASGVPDFTITANPSTVTTPQGQFATTVLTVTPLYGFAEQVTLSCSNLPAQVTCDFSPVIASTAKGAFTSTLQVQTQGASGALSPPAFGVHHERGTALAWVLPGVLALVGFGSLRRRALRGLTGSRLAGLALLLVAGSVGLGGCNQRYGYEHHPPSVPTGTLKGTYTLTIAASGNDGSAVTEHDIHLILQVQ